MFRLKFRHRIAALVLLAAIALVAVTAVTLVLGRRSESQLTGIETRYVPLLELDRDLNRLAAEITKAFEDAAGAGEQSKLDDAGRLKVAFLDRIDGATQTIADNGADPAGLRQAFVTYFAAGYQVSAELAKGTPGASLSAVIENMRRARRDFMDRLELATSPDRRRLTDAFATARESQHQSLTIDIVVACAVLALMGTLSWKTIRRLSRSLRAVSDGVKRLAGGDFGHEIDVPGGDEIGDLAHEANRTARRLRAYREASDNDAWIESGLTELAGKIAGELDLVTLGRRGMEFLATYVDAAGAVVVARDANGGSRVLGTHGGPVEMPVEVGNEIRVFGTEGTYVIVVPLTHENQIMGVLSLAMSQSFDERVLGLLSRARTILGIALRVAESRERTQALLIETQRQAHAAQTSNKELEAFSYSVSHDLRAPLRGIDGLSQALVEDESDRLSPKGHDYLRRIRAGAQRMAELIDDLLQLSKVSRGDFKRERVDLSVLARGVIDELRQPERDVELVIQDDMVAVADARLIRITLENLLGNAWKFTSKVARARIEFGVRDDAGTSVYFVRDNGAGFDMKYAERLFGAFQRLHTDKEFPGTGIGLATVHRIVLRHGGRIWVDAAVGQGATFHFTLVAERPG